MDSTVAHSVKGIQLKDRFLWSDGDSTVSADQIIGLVSRGIPVEGLFVDELTAEIRQYNQFVDVKQRITKKESTQDNDLSWNLPETYLEMDPWSYITSQLTDYLNAGGYVSKEGEVSKEGLLRIKRVSSEIQLYKKLNLGNFLRAIIYIINTLRAKNMVWGVGRGSSVSSYILYILGVHDVDSVAYDLDIDEFLRVE